MSYTGTELEDDSKMVQYLDETNTNLLKDQKQLNS